jgi:hypothetical protein
MLCYTTPSRAWLWARYSRQEAFPEIARHAGEQGSIGFQPVSGFVVETGLNPDGLFEENHPKPHLIFAPLNPA